MRSSFNTHAVIVAKAATPADATCTGVEKGVGEERDGNDAILAMFSCEAVVRLRDSMMNEV